MKTDSRGIPFFHRKVFVQKKNTISPTWFRSSIATTIIRLLCCGARATKCWNRETQEGGVVEFDLKKI